MKQNLFFQYFFPQLLNLVTISKIVYNLYIIKVVKNGHKISCPWAWPERLEFLWKKKSYEQVSGKAQICLLKNINK